MSTDHQKYSTENQADAIREYAVRRNMETVRTYTDAGKSGLKLDGRDALKQLISDVQSVAAEFSAILVLDVTRWGRDFRYIEINRQLRKLYPEIVEGAIRRIQEMGGVIRREVTNDLIVLNEEIKVSVVICRCVQTAAGSNRWKLHLDTGLLPDITIVIRMDENTVAPLDYYLLPAIDIENPKIRLTDNNHLALEAYRFEDLEPFFMLIERTEVPEAA